MKKVLFLAKNYYPKPNANGICIHQVGLALKNMGYEVHVLCSYVDDRFQEKKHEGIYIHYIKDDFLNILIAFGEKNINKFKGSLINKTGTLIKKIKILIYLPFYPLTSLLFNLRYFKKADKLQKINKFDILISVYNPVESCISGLHMKKKYKNLKWVLYVLDSFSNANTSRYLSRKFLDTKGWQWEQKFYGDADMILNQQSHEKHHSQERYKPYKNKMVTTDIPLFTVPNINLEEPKKVFDINYIHLVYTGALYPNIRDPMYLCKVFMKVNSNCKYKLHFYSKGVFESSLREHQVKSKNGIIRHGYVKHYESLEAIYNADILISLGNKNSKMVPSKTFEYVSTGKRIIHFYDNEQDSSLFYFRRYPLVLLVNENENIELNTKKIIDFISKPYNKVDFNDISNAYIKNTPEYSAKLITNVI